jgi:hypothetical protein
MAKKLSVVLACVAAMSCASGASSDSFIELTPYPGWTGPPAASSGPEVEIFRPLRSQSEWSALWKTLRPHSVGQNVDAPLVDFSKFTMLVAALGTRPTGGYTVQFQYAWDNGSTLLISVLEGRPGHGCMSTTTLTYPVAIVLVPRTDHPATFQVDSADINCGATRSFH